MNKRCITAALLAALLTLSLTACGGQESSGQEETGSAGIAVQTETVASETIAAENKVSGRIAADDETTVMVAVSAKITAVYAETGDEVKAGDVLCTLDLGSSLASYSAARISYDAAVQSHADQKAILDMQVSMAEDNMANTKALFDIGAASQLEVDQAELNYHTAVAGRSSALSQLEAGIQSARSSLEQLDVVLENVDGYGNVIAPASGVLVAMNAVENSFTSSAMPLAVIDGAEQMKVTVSVSETLIPKIAAGDSAEVYVGAAEQRFTAIVRSVEQSASAQTKLYTVTLSVPAEVTGLLSGMFADVTFHTDISENVVVIPTEAILTSNDTQYVYIVENGAARYVEVATGLTGSGVTEIISGLEEGQQLVTVGQAYLEDGVAVRIVASETDAAGGAEASPADSPDQPEAEGEDQQTSAEGE